VVGGWRFVVSGRFPISIFQFLISSFHLPISSFALSFFRL
jgi:hypothetical protein